MGERSQVAGSARRGTVLVAGAINTDLVGRVRRAPEAGETVTGDSFAVFGGGKGANQAVAAARSGSPTAMLGAVGGDDFGRQRLADLRAEGIDVSAVATVDDPSGVALISVEATGQNRILYVPGATLTVGPEVARMAVERLRPAVVLLTLELPAATLVALVEAARTRGATVVLNATPEPETARSLLGLVDVLVVNEGEAVALLGDATPDSTDSDGAVDWLQVASRLRTEGPAAVVVTLGAAGAAVDDGGQATVLPAPRVEVVDTTGAGDAACGALAARLAAGDDIVTAARVGVLAGALAVTRAGAQPSMPRREAIDAALGPEAR